MTRSHVQDPVWIELDEADVARAKALAEARLGEASRRLSPDRPSARNLPAQVRGACGEIAAEKWLRSLGFVAASGFDVDSMHESDLRIGQVRLEIMTAQIEHRRITGFCVPPNKLAAARRRGAWGYLFAGTGAEVPCRRVMMQAAIRLDRVDADPPRRTSVSAASPSVLNHVMRPQDLLHVSDMPAAAGLRPGKES